MSNQILLDANHFVLKTASGKVLQKDLNFRLKLGQLLVIQGDNGTGKTTLLKAIISGSKHSKSLSLNVAKTKIGYIPQVQDNDFPIPITLKDVIKMECDFDKDKILNLGFLTEKHLNLDWSQASGGEKKRTLLTRTLLQEPILLVLDEPFNHLDSNSSREMLQFIIELVETDSLGIVLVTHGNTELDKLSPNRIERVVLC